MNKHVVITGACGGIGRSTVQKFADNGYNVIGIDIKEPKQQWKGDFYHVDISSPKDISNFSNQLEERNIKIDSLINIASIVYYKSILQTSIAEWTDTFSTNVRSIFLLVKNLYDKLNKPSSIVNVGSVHSIATSKEIGVYAASKGAIEAFTRALALELSPEIRVNCILPGAVKTPMLTAGLSRGKKSIDSNLKKLENKTPLKRIGHPNEIADVIYFLSSCKNSFMTGASVIVDGGALAKLSTE